MRDKAEPITSDKATRLICFAKDASNNVLRPHQREAVSHFFDVEQGGRRAVFVPANYGKTR